MTAEVVLLLGSNAPRRVRRLREGISALRARVDVQAVSRIHASAPAGRGGQPWFLNVAVRGTTALSPEGLLAFVKGIEAAAGRKAGPRFGPRELDVDILLMGGKTVAAPGIEVPHPRLAQRRFCLAPASEVAADRPVPPSGITVRDLLASCPDPLEVVPL